MNVQTTRGGQMDTLDPSAEQQHRHLRRRVTSVMFGSDRAPADIEARRLLS
jgi:hypothetical protein